MPKHHREYCAHCLKGGDLICCDECERTFHLRCVRNIYKSQVEIEDDSVFNCPECLLFPDRYYIPISNLLANPELHKKYRDIICYRLYDTEIVSSVNSLPTMRMLLLYLEFVVPPQQIKILAKLVSRYVPYLDKPFAHRELGLNFNCLVASLREAVSSDVFDDAYHNLLEGKTALAFATIPSPTYFSNPCPTCKHHRYFHCFCYFCGHVFNVVEDYKADMMRYSNFNPLNSVIVAQANVRSVSTSKFVSQKDRVVAIETFPPPEMQGGGSSSDASDNSVCSIQMPVQSPYTPEVLDNAVPKNHCDPEDDTLSGNSKNYNKAISELHERALSLVSLNQREETALKGIRRYFIICHSHQLMKVESNVHGGNMLFLLEVIASTALGVHRTFAKIIFFYFCEKWLAQFPILAADSEADEIHDVIIGVHAVQQLLRANSTVSELRNEHVDQDHVAFLDAWLRKFSNEKQSKNADESLLKLIAQFSMKNFHRSQEECEEVLSTSGSFEEKYPRKKVRKEEIVGKEDNCFEDVNNEADMTPSYSTVTHTSQGVGNSDSVENHPRINSRRGFKRNRKYGDGIKLILTKGLWVYDDEAKKRILPILNVDCYSSILEIEMQQLKHLLGNVHTEEEIIACRIEQGVPLTRKDYCSNSNCILSTGKNLNMEEKLKEPMRPKDSRSGNTKESSGNIERIVFECNRCGNVTLQSINYQVLIDLAVFPYLLRDLRIPTMSERSGFIYLEKSLEILPISRSYRTYDELGEHNYTLQCYHATHLVYIYTDWGKYPVNRQLFAEEFDFILRNMHIAIWLKDVEIVGEFLHCMKIMQFDREMEPVVAEIFDAGIAFIDRSKAALSGMWKTKGKSVYCDFHTCFCATIALLDHTNSKQNSDSQHRVANIVSLF